MGKKSELLLQFIFVGLTAGVICLLLVKLYPDWYFNHQKALAYNQNQKALEKVISSPKIVAAEQELPSSIHIESADIHIPVAPGVITDDVWTLYDDKATWLSTSAIPGTGNTVIYAHNRKHLFGNLPNITIGSIIQVTTNKKNYLYVVKTKKEIAPTNLQAILSEKNQLTLYTCDGYLDQWRLLVTASFKEVL